MCKMRSTCRTCGTNTNKTISSNLFAKSNEQLLSLVEDLTNLFLESDNTLPEYVCQDCATFLNQIVEFRLKCLKVHKELLERMRKKIQNPINEDNTSLGNLGIEGDGNIHEEAIDVDMKLSEVEESPDPPPALTTHSKISKKVVKKKESKKTWICELCGGEFKCSTYLRLHLLRHTGKKDIECDICQAKYYTENEMRRHRILHTDARPYACRYCDKTFRGCSSKVVHERTHTNERPFACQFCDKTFRSTASKQNHEKIHINNRNYHCETCDQWFLRSSHLHLHRRTKLHMKRASGAVSNS